MVETIVRSRTIARCSWGKKICMIFIAARWQSQTISVGWWNLPRRRPWS